MEREIFLLVCRRKSDNQQHFELGEKVIVLAKQSKVDQLDLVACYLRSQKEVRNVNLDRFTVAMDGSDT